MINIPVDYIQLYSTCCIKNIIDFSYNFSAFLTWRGFMKEGAGGEGAINMFNQLTLSQ